MRRTECCYTEPFYVESTNSFICRNRDCYNFRNTVYAYNKPETTNMPANHNDDISQSKVVANSLAPQEKAKSDKVGTGLALIPFYSILAIGKIFIEGLRYGRDNWKKGVGDKEYQEERLEHAMLHLIKWKEGDRSEAHLAKVAWFCITQLELERLEDEKQPIATPNDQATT